MQMKATLINSIFIIHHRFEAIRSLKLKLASQRQWTAIWTSWKMLMTCLVCINVAMIQMTIDLFCSLNHSVGFYERFLGKQLNKAYCTFLVYSDETICSSKYTPNIKIDARQITNALKHVTAEKRCAASN